ncbi:MAG: SMP-30/gluconolactonase/LRE family protein [Gemmatimonadaceae bacterium]
MLGSIRCAAAALALAMPLSAQVTRDVVSGNPVATVDLATRDGAALLGVRWRYHDVDIVDATNHAAGPDHKPSGAENRTHDISLHAGARDFDDAAWETIEPTSLDARRTAGRLAFGWYRTRLTIPERVGTLATSGTSAVFEIVVDDYSEVWVDGVLVPVAGQSGGGLVRGWNAPNRLVIGRDLKPGQEIQLAIFAANGPLSDPPPNFVWIRSATIDFYREAQLGHRFATGGSVERLDPALDAIVPRGATIETVATGFQFIEGPVWHPDGYLLFSDPNANVIYRWNADGAVSVFRTKSGYADVDIGAYHQPGSNGLTLDAAGRLVIDEHGRRRVSRLETNGVVTTLVDRFDGKRLNSPNDLVYKSDGALYFTDPPFGLPDVFGDGRKELPFSGVYRLAGGELRLLTRELTGPNGLAFSPDERFLYVDDWDVAHKVIMRYPLRTDGSLGEGTVFVDATRSHPGEQAWDGLKVDRAGNVYAAGPGGVWIISPAGVHLGTIVAPETPANMAWGDADARTLYLAARTGLYRIRLDIPGIRPAPVGAVTQAGSALDRSGTR